MWRNGLKWTDLDSTLLQKAYFTLVKKKTLWFSARVNDLCHVIRICLKL